VTEIDFEAIAAFLGSNPLPLHPSPAIRFEFIRDNHILNLQFDAGAMTAHIEIFGDAGGQPLTSIALEYCEKVEVKNGQLEIETTTHCEECSAMKSERYTISITPQIKIMKW